MLRSEEQLINWLLKNTAHDRVIHSILTQGQVTLVSECDLLPGSDRAGWLVQIRSPYDTMYALCVPKDQFGRPLHWYEAPYVPEAQQQKESPAELSRSVDRIKRRAPIHPEEDRGDSVRSVRAE